MDDDDTMAFEITDYDLDNEFNPNRKKRKFTKNDAIYGVWNDEDEEDEDEGGPGLGGKGMSFVAGGSNEEERERKRKDRVMYEEHESEDDRPSLGLGAKSFTPDPLGAEIKSDFGKKEKPKPAAPKQRPDKEFGAWEKHTKGIGMKLLEKMGYKKGEGIGRDKEGRVNPVDAKLRNVKKGGLGFGGDERTPQQKKDAAKVKTDEDEEEEIREQIKLWKKGVDPSQATAIAAERRAPKPKYTIGGLSRVAAAQATAQQTKVIDMTGPQARVLSGYDQIVGHKKPISIEEQGSDQVAAAMQDKSMPELQYNIRLLVEYAEGEIQTLDSKLAAEKDALAVLGQECKKVATDEKRQRDQVERLEQVLEMIEDSERRRQQGSPPGLDECVVLFRRLQMEYHDEFEVFDLGYLAVALVYPLVEEHMKGWQPMAQPTYGLDLFRLWMDVLHDTAPKNPRERYMDAYERLLWEKWLPKVRTVLGQWDPRNHGPVFSLVSGWSKALPDWLLDNVLDQLVFPKISQAVEVWNPQTDTVPIHQWLHPWIPIMGQRMHTLYPLIRHKLMVALQMWQPADPSAHAILLPWKNVFSAADMETILTRAIIPKLLLVLQSFQINPAHQLMEPLQWVLAWVDLVPPQHMVPMFEANFFPKWSQVLVHWLNSNPNYDEVTNWYLGWKKVLPPELTNHGPIQSQFRWALDTMNQAVAQPNKPVPMPVGGQLESTQYFSELSRQQAAHVALTAQRDRDRQADTVAGPSFRDLLQQLALENDIVFQPKKPPRMHNGNPLYAFGRLTVYMDRNVIFVQEGAQWLPVSMDGLVQKAKAQK